MVIATMLLLIIGSGLRILITSDSLDREYRIISTYEQMNSGDDTHHLKKSAQVK